MKKLLLVILSALMCLSFVSCGRSNAETPTDVPTDAQQGLWTQKVNEIGATIENEQIVCYNEQNEYIEFLAVKYTDGARVSETIYRIYYDEDLYETKGKAEFIDKPGYTFNDTVWYVQCNSSLFGGANYSEDLKFAYEKLNDKYTVKVPMVGYD